MSKPLDIMQGLEIRDDQGNVVAYLIPAAEHQRNQDIDLSEELRTRRNELAVLRGQLATAHQTIADLNRAHERLLKERADLEAERNEYLRALYFMSNPETAFTEADRQASLASGKSLNDVIAELSQSTEG